MKYRDNEVACVTVVGSTEDYASTAATIYLYQSIRKSCRKGEQWTETSEYQKGENCERAICC